MLASKKSADMKVSCRRCSRILGLGSRARNLETWPVFLFHIDVDINSVALLVAGFISSIVFIVGKVALAEVIPVVASVISAFALALLIPLVFRIIMIFTCGTHCR